MQALGRTEKYFSIKSCVCGQLFLFVFDYYLISIASLCVTFLGTILRFSHRERQLHEWIERHRGKKKKQTIICERAHLFFASPLHPPSTLSTR